MCATIHPAQYAVLLRPMHYALRQETVWLGDTPIAVVKKDPVTQQLLVYYIQADHLNTPRVILDTANTPVWRWDNSDAFGNTLPNEDPDGDGKKFEYNPRFPGQYFDKETGLHYNYYRDYDPKTGKYPQSDPIGLAGGLNTYGYVGGNPVGLIDPTGQFEQVLIPGAVIGTGVAAILCASNPALCQKAVQGCFDGIDRMFSENKKDTLKPGPFAGDSVPARGPGRDFNQDERNKINEIGQTTGCHTCGTIDPGTKGGNFVPDHQPPNALNPEGDAQDLFPQCISCSRTQGGQVRGRGQQSNSGE